MEIFIVLREELIFLGKICFQELAKGFFDRGRDRDAADALVGEAINDQRAGFGFQHCRDDQQVFFAVDADVAGFFNRQFDGLPGRFLDRAGWVVDGQAEGVARYEILALDLVVEDLDVGFQVVRAVIAHGYNKGIFILIE